MITLNPLYFDKAANLIEENGWWGSFPVVAELELPAIGAPSPLCIANALNREIGILPGDERRAHLSALVEYFGLQHVGQVFSLNDTQPAETGKQWAVNSLREIAQQIRERNKQ